MVHPDAPEDSPQRRRLLEAFYFLCCFSLSLIGIRLAEYTLLNHDMAGIIAFAQEMLRGKRLYIDLLTSQCPFIVYMMMIPIKLHGISGLPIPSSFHLCMFLLLQACVLFGWHIAKKNPICVNASGRYTLLLVFYYGLFIFPFEGESFLSSFGQREHIFCALLLPYIISIINRIQGIKTTRAELIAIGLLAGAGFCIKPYFLILFILPELFLMINFRSLTYWNRIDVWIIALFSLLYYGLFFVSGLMEAYWNLVPHFVINHQGYKIAGLFIGFFVLISMAVPAWVVFLSRTSSYFRVSLFFLTLIGGGETIYILQQLHYFYHCFPIYFFSLLLFVWTALSAGKRILAFLMLPLFFCYVSLESTVPPDVSHFIKRRSEILNEAVLLAPYKTVVFLNTDMGAFPVINYTDVQWDLSLPFLEYLPETYSQWQKTYKEPPYHTPEQMGENERFFHEIIIKDLQRMPDAIVIDESQIKLGFVRMSFDYLHYFMLDPRFQEIWKHYEFAARVSKRYNNFLDVPNEYDVIYRRKD